MVFMTICQAKITRNVSMRMLFMISDSRHDPNKKNMAGSASGSMTFWCGSGSADPCLSASDFKKMVSDPDPAIFVTDLQDANKKLIKKFFPHITFGRYIYIIIQR
jgi:hypothetical protein